MARITWKFTGWCLVAGMTLVVFFIFYNKYGLLPGIVAACVVPIAMSLYYWRYKWISSSSKKKNN